MVATKAKKHQPSTTIPCTCTTNNTKKTTTTHNQACYSNNEILMASTTTDMPHQLMFNRQLSFARILQRAPPRTLLLQMHRSIKTMHSYISQIQIDLQQLQQYIPHKAPSPKQFDSFKSYLSTANWRSSVRRAKQKSSPLTNNIQPPTFTSRHPHSS